MNDEYFPTIGQVFSTMFRPGPRMSRAQRKARIAEGERRSAMTSTAKEEARRIAEREQT